MLGSGRRGPPLNPVPDLAEPVGEKAVMLRRFLALAAVVWLLLVARPAHAYLDPASGSILLQLVLGGVAGVALILKLYWRKIRGLFGAGKEEHDEPEP